MKKFFLIPTLILCLLSILIFNGCQSKSGSYPPTLIWNNINYALSLEEVSNNELGKQLGEVKRKMEPMPKENGDANDAPVGSKIFEIKGIDIKDAIAFEKNSKFYKARKINPSK